MSSHRECTRHERGFTLIELMIAITIGLLIVVGILRVFDASKQSYNLQEGVSRAQETGRAGIFILNRTLRHAGFYRNPALRTTEVLAAFPAGVSYPAASPYPVGPTFTAGAGIAGLEGGANPDTVVVRYQGHEDGSLLDCHGIPFDCVGNAACTLPGGNPVTNPVMGTFAFFLSEVDATTGTRSLQCRRVIPTAGPPTNAINDNSPLLEGITDFQVWYGVDTNADALADRYLTANNVLAADWTNVVSLRVRLVTNSVSTVGTGTASNRIEQTYNTVVYLRDG